MGAVAKRSRKQMHIQTLIEVFHLHISQERRDHLRVQIYWLIQLVKSNMSGYCEKLTPTITIISGHVTQSTCHDTGLIAPDQTNDNDSVRTQMNIGAKGCPG